MSRSETDRGPIRILLVDDQALLRSGLRMVLEDQEGLLIVGEADDGASGIAETLRLSPDVVLMDIRMPGVDGVEATRLICQQSEARVLVLTTFDLDEYAFMALRHGASGFLLKDVPPDQLVEAIRNVAAGDAVVAPSVTRRLLDRFASHLPDGAEAEGGFERGPLALLTEREREILVEIAGGYSNREIAARLYLAEATVKTHLGRILHKLGLRDRAQAVVLAYQSGLVRPDGQGPAPR